MKRNQEWKHSLELSRLTSPKLTHGAELTLADGRAEWRERRAAETVQKDGVD
jgi:hypothetical protein